MKHRTLALRFPLLAIWTVAIVYPLSLAPLRADDSADSIDGHDLQPGLVAEYAAPNQSFRRVDDRIAFRWGESSPDARLSNGDFSALWQGLLRVQTPGEYRFHVQAVGRVTIQLGDAKLLDRSCAGNELIDSASTTLDFGEHPLVVSFQKTGSSAKLCIYWSGPGFGPEPIPHRWLLHEAADGPSSEFERGRKLVRAHRCDACHLTDIGPLAAPSLQSVHRSLKREWLVGWLAGRREEHSDRRMPSFEISLRDSRAITAFLFDASAKDDSTRPVDLKPRDPTGDPTLKAKSIAAGEQLFLSLGCLACHELNGLGSSDPFGGGDLSGIATKRPPDFFERWLRDPASINKNHRMPVFELSAKERRQLSAYLATVGARSDRQVSGVDGPYTQPLVERGAELVRSFRCGSCHELPDGASPMAADDPMPSFSELAATNNWGSACWGSVGAGRKKPGYRLSASERSAIRTYLIQSQHGEKVDPAERGAQVLAESNCLGCHSLGNDTGISELLPAIAERNPKLTGLLPALKAPSLTDIGDKLRTGYLSKAIGGDQSRHRPWLHVRMPKFRLNDTDRNALLKHLTDTSRMPADETEANLALDNSLSVAGTRLVTADGFGCTSCHAIGDVSPEKVAPNQLGPNLAMLGDRLRAPWFRRWMHDPARIVPGMEMPAVRIPIQGVLDGGLDSQIQSLWHVLNQEGFQPPKPHPVRVVRRSNIAGCDERSVVLTDLLEVGEKSFIKPLAIGLANRNNVLFDLESNSLAAWWLGDTAAQHTRGKSWYWEAAGAQLWQPAEFGSELLLEEQTEQTAPDRRGQFVTEYDVMEHVPKGIRFVQGLDFPGDSGRRLEVVQTFTATDHILDGSGFHRNIRIRNSAGQRWRLRLAAVQGCRLINDRTAAAWDGQFTISIVSAPTESRLLLDDLGVPWLTSLSAGEDSTIQISLDYRTLLPVDEFHVPRVEIPPQPKKTINVAPGYEITILPLNRQLMPTGIAWRDDGRLFVSSLKGRVWMIWDTDGDGFEDASMPFSDELAAPYGLAIHGDAVDVINKYALLRLVDEDNDGRADRTVTLASGWGHTDDYHDWAVGLPRDEKGRYYVALPCQQDERSTASAHLRGKALRLSPEIEGNYSIELICGGLRFPMGLALNGEEALFATDNQGNYNPFNELNHLIPGARYGFINELERRAGLDPPLIKPSIDIPHPWVRSVNGICFLDTPAGFSPGHFGPFEGHLLGCEYDNRALVRMSLQKAGDTYQGAIYPFTVFHDSSEPLEGPIVCQVAPDGDIYVGNMHDSGWGAGANTGSIARLKPTGNLPFGIAEITALSTGFQIEFTRPIESQFAENLGNYSIESFRRISTPEYGGEDVDREKEEIFDISLSADRAHVELRLGRMRAGFVYEFHLRNLAPEGELLHPAEAFYTLNRIPSKNSSRSWN